MTSRRALLDVSATSTNASVRIATLRALLAICPDGDAATADALDAAYAEARAIGDEARVTNLALYPQVAAQLRARLR